MNKSLANIAEVVNLAKYRSCQFVSRDLTALIDLAEQLLLEWSAVDLAQCEPEQRINLINSFIELKLVIAAFDKAVVDEASDITERLDRSLTHDEIVALIKQKRPELLRVTLA